MPPGAGENGVPLQSLFGFERVHVPAGQTVTVYLYPTLVDLTVVTALGERVAQPGSYTVRFGLRETATMGQGFATHTFTAN